MQICGYFSTDGYNGPFNETTTSSGQRAERFSSTLSSLLCMYYYSQLSSRTVLYLPQIHSVEQLMPLLFQPTLGAGWWTRLHLRSSWATGGGSFCGLFHTGRKKKRGRKDKNSSWYGYSPWKRERERELKSSSNGLPTNKSDIIFLSACF